MGLINKSAMISSSYWNWFELDEDKKVVWIEIAIDFLIEFEEPCYPMFGEETE